MGKFSFVTRFCRCLRLLLPTAFTFCRNFYTKPDARQDEIPNDACSMDK